MTSQDAKQSGELRGAYVALTGATGAVGGTVRQLLEQQGCRVALVGRQDEDTARWDLREPLPADAARVFASVDLVVHCAADVRLAQDNVSARRANTEAVGELVDVLTAAPQPPRLVHVSTAFVEGEHRNPYEQSKQRAEQLVRDSGLHGGIVRPSLVIGNRADGHITRFSGVYTLVRLAALGMVPAVPVRSTMVIDLVPVDLVGEVIVAAARAALAAGRPGMPVTVAASGAAAPTVQSLFDIGLDVMSQRLGRAFPAPPFVDPDTYERLFRPLLLPELSGGQRRLIEALEVYLPYFTASHAFEETVLRLTRHDIDETWRKSVAHWLDRNDTSRLLRRSTAWSPRRAS